MIELLEELHGLQVLASTKLVRNPLALLAGIVEVEHRSHGIHAQAVHVEALTPEEGIGSKEISNFMAPKIEDERAPILMGPLPRVGVLIKGCAVELCQRPGIPGKMGGHPVHNDADPGPMQRIDEELEVVRRAVATGRCVEAGDLVSPARIVRVFGNGQKLDMGKTQLANVFDEGASELPISQRLPAGPALPGSQVNLVDAHRAPQRVGLTSPAHPLLIGPGELLIVPDHRSMFGRQFEKFAKGVRDQLQVSSRVEKLKLV